MISLKTVLTQKHNVPESTASIVLAIVFQRRSPGNVGSRCTYDLKRELIYMEHYNFQDTDVYCSNDFKQSMTS
jgi:hypothetical protein